MANCGQASNRTPAFAACGVAAGVSNYLPVHFLSSRSSVAHGLEGVEGELVKVAVSKSEKNTATENAPLPPLLFGRRFVFAGPLMRNAQLRSQTLKSKPLEKQFF